MDVAREDLSLFLNACAVATGQREFYSSDSQQQVSLKFLHQYICVNYRLLYGRSLAAGMNHFNQAEIIFQLLSSGRICPPESRKEESALITAALRNLPIQRVWKLFARLQRERVNNRRTRKVIHNFIAVRKNLAFDAVKYRSKLRAAVRHTHMKLPGELPVFLFQGKQKVFKTPFFEKYRAAQYSQEAMYDLPYSIAEGFAAKHGVSRSDFLQKIEGKMTERERLRLQSGSDTKVTLNPERLSLTELCVYVLSLSLSERQERCDLLRQWLETSARSSLQKMGELQLAGRVAAVLDNSYSSIGSREKQNRPLAVALAAHLLLKASGFDYKAFWTCPVSDELLVHPKAQTHVTERILDALEWGARIIVIISDGCENDVPEAATAIIEGYRKIGGTAQIIHLNPVFDPETYQVRPLTPCIPALGLRTGEDLSVTLAFARWSDDDATLEELESYLQKRVDTLLKNDYARH